MASLKASPPVHGHCGLSHQCMSFGDTTQAMGPSLLKFLYIFHIAFIFTRIFDSLLIITLNFIQYFEPGGMSVSALLFSLLTGHFSPCLFVCRVLVD